MQRMGMVIGLKPEKIAEYKRLHADAWPDILDMISKCNIRNYSIFLKEPENLLFGYWEYHGTDFKADAATEILSRGGNSPSPSAPRHSTASHAGLLSSPTRGDDTQIAISLELCLSARGRGYEGRASKASPWPKLVRGRCRSSSAVEFRHV